MALRSNPSFAASFSLESLGAYPMTAPSLPATVQPLMVRRGLTPRASAFSLDMTTTAAAPSFRLEELPAVTVPPFTKHGFKRSSFSMVWLALGPSSVSKTVMFPFLSFNSTGRISSLNLPASMAAAALRWLSRAYWSCSWRVTLYFSATFSAVTPLW